MTHTFPVSRSWHVAEKAILLPSGDQSGKKPYWNGLVSRRTPLPSAFMTYKPVQGGPMPLSPR